MHDMIRNYIRTAFRSLKKQKGFTAINVLGLSVGLATCLSIVLYVVDELSYDHYNTKAERIFRVNLIEEKIQELAEAGALKVLLLGHHV